MAIQADRPDTPVAISSMTSRLPIAICGMALRLPGGLESPQQLWDFLVAKGDAKGRVPESRYNVSSYHSKSKRPGTIATEYGYFLDENVKLGCLDTSRFSLSREELYSADPQVRQMLEVVRECFDDAGDCRFRGTKVGCYVGSYGEDWLEIQNKDPQQSGPARVDGYSDFMLSNRISHEMDLRGPSMTIRTACSSALVGLHEACLAIERGECASAIVGGSNLILAPRMTAFMTEKDVLSPDGSCKTFSADADGYARGEAITAVYIKPLDSAIRDGNPVRAVVRSTTTNSDGRTPGLSTPSTESQEALIRKAYELAGITDFSQTAFAECHGTGTSVGDPIETNAIARVFGDSGVYIGSIKPNLGHSEGASGVSSLMKAVLALEHRTIPPNIKFSSPNPKIPFQEANLTVPLEPTPWPESRQERVSVNSFGIGGSNAHVIVESACNTPRPPRANQLASSPHLLLFSAATPPSLRKMKESFQDLVSEKPEDLQHLAYTLANRREHLAHRAFMVTRRDRPGVPSQGRNAASLSHSLIMVFTGQGAQWPRMGRELLQRPDLPFRSSIRAMDQFLHDIDAHQWTLEEELQRPARTSHVHAADMSQPLCTAIQIALVDLFASVGVKPTAVVGHSSGEIAAAYAAGAITAREAIIAAWQRGLAAKKQTRPGAMAAVGLGCDEVQAFLGSKVVVACENSHKSVTLSGDTDVVQEAVSCIKKSHPDAMVRLLKVDKAYHSYHMREIGEGYGSALQQYLAGASPTVPFFSSVTGKEERDPIGALYWRKNLESPVLFKTAVSGILDRVQTPTFLEIGSHGALAGPLRQILAHASSSAPYVSAMTRGEDCVESFLAAVGTLYELNIPIDFNALMPDGVCLPDLPHYPWDHEVDYWRETRMAHEWRNREHASHPLLGVRQLESSSLEPSWRNLLAIDEASWLRDHKVDGNIIFPCAGYVGIVAEAIRQISGSREGFTLRHAIISSALLLSESTKTEIVTTFRPHRLTDSLDSRWWDFTIVSFNGHVWTKHFTGQVTSHVGALTQSLDGDPLPVRFEHRKFYNLSARAGLMFGPLFQRLRSLRTGTVDSLASAKISRDKCEDEDDYHLHPTVVDACIQSAFAAALMGAVDAKYYRAVPTKIDKLVLRQCDPDADMSVSASALNTRGTREVIGRMQQCIANGKVVLQMEGLRLSPLEEDGATDSNSLQITARLSWKPDIDFLDAASLIKPSFPRHLYNPSLDELNRLCVVYSHRQVKITPTTVPHLQKYQAWIDRQFQVVASGPHSSMTKLDDETLMGEVKALVHQMSDTPVAGCATALQKIATDMHGIFSEDSDALEILRADDTLTQLYEAADASDRSQFLQHLAHAKSNLRVLEIGAGTGASTASMLKDLDLPGPSGLPLYSKYTFTDISSGFFVAAKERFKDRRNMEYRTLDISQDPFEQGFDDTDKYDLIVATNVIHATRSLGESLKNVHKLLAPTGRLLLHELHSTSKWFNFIFGTLPGWWYGEADGRADEPYVAPARWEKELMGAGLGLDAVVLDSDEPDHWNAIMVAKPVSNRETGPKAVTLLSDTVEGFTHSLSRRLQSKGYKVDFRQLGEELPVSQDVISLLDLKGPFFQAIDESRLKAFQRLLESLGQSGLLWITRPSQVRSREPSYAQVIGAGRVIRTEMLLDFATCEVEDCDSSLDRIIDVFCKFQKRQEDESLKPDYEYAIVGGKIHVGRIHPFAQQAELHSEASSEDQLFLDMAKPGRLSSLQWSARAAKSLVRNEVEVEVYAAGLNFRNVLESLGLIAFSEAGLGLEAGGIVSRVGPEVKDLAKGDRVMLFGRGSFSTHVITSELLCEKIPSSLRFEGAASMPVVFATALYSLFDIGGLRKGQSILIHSACGGVGLAAIQLAKMAGAEIFATVSTEDKIEHLTEKCGISRDHIFTSRSMDFVEGLMRETKGKGVDLALNSLSGELLHATWHCVAEFGQVVDIGIRDFLDAGKLDMDVFLGNRTYTCFTLDAFMEKRPFVVKRLLQDTVNLFKKGQITPLNPTSVFDASSAEVAFRQMQGGQHIGKIVIAIRSEDGSTDIDMSSIKKAKELRLDRSASYLLVGGFGGLGRSVSRYFVQHNAGHLIFLSRSAGTNEKDQDFVRELKSMGCKAQIIKGSVTSKADVSQAIQQAPNLKGIVQCSMTLRDQAFTRMSLDEWEAAVAPKVQGTWNLHNETLAAGVQLDFFVLFSSMSGLFGQNGQANYAAANTFLDAFVQYRKSLGLAASSIDIGAVQDVGYVFETEGLLKRMKVPGAHLITEPELLQTIGAAILPFSAADQRNPGEDFSEKGTVILGLDTTVPLNGAEQRAYWRKDRRMAAYHNASSTMHTQSATSNDALKVFLAKAKDDDNVVQTEETAAFLGKEIGRKLASFLLRSDDDLDMVIPLSQLGVDSLVAVEMRAWWRQAFGFDITVLEFLGMGNLAALGRHAAEGLQKVFGHESAA